MTKSFCNLVSREKTHTVNEKGTALRHSSGSRLLPTTPDYLHKYLMIKPMQNAGEIDCFMWLLRNYLCIANLYQESAIYKSNLYLRWDTEKSDPHKDRVMCQGTEDLVLWHEGHLLQRAVTQPRKCCRTFKMPRR